MVDFIHNNKDRYGVRKVWQKLKREGYVIARCTVARLMQKLGIQGVWRFKTSDCLSKRLFIGRIISKPD